MLKALNLISLSFLVSTALQALPFESLKIKDSLTSPQSLLFRGQNHLLVLADGAQSKEFAQTYVVQVGDQSRTLNELLPRYGQVLLHEIDDYAVVRLDDQAVPRLSAELHHLGLGCGSLFRLYGDVVTPHMKKPAFDPVFDSDQDLSAVRSAFQHIQPAQIRMRVEQLSAHPTRHHQSESGWKIPGILVQEYRAMAGDRKDIQVEAVDHGSRTRQNSIVVRIPGYERPDELVLLGSHIDSTSFFRRNAPGADDNASGTATNMELFRALLAAGMRFQRTVEIHGYAAEEVGLVGSQAIAKDYREQGKNVVAMMQFDMNLYKPSGSQDQIWLVGNNTDDQFNQFLGKLVDRYLGIPWQIRALTAGTSDHQSWHRQGFRVAFPFENPSDYNRHIHTARDIIENSNAFDQAAQFAKLGLAYLAHFAGVERRS